MRNVSRAVVAGVVVMVLAGCSGGSGAEEPEPSAPSSTIPNAGEPAPPEALAPAPSIQAADDARVLLKPGGDLNLLKIGVASNVLRLSNVHVEEVVVAEGTFQYSFDVDDSGECSGTYIEDGVTYEFVSDGERMVLTTDQGPVGEKLAGRWFEIPDHPLIAECGSGPVGVTFLAENGAGRWWWLEDAERVGVATVDGRRTVHFRKVDGEVVADTWVFAEGATPRLAKLSRTDAGGVVRTLTFSEFDSATPVRAFPPEDQIVAPSQATA